jgi:hypothetical protein
VPLCFQFSHRRPIGVVRPGMPVLKEKGISCRSFESGELDDRSSLAAAGAQDVPRGVETPVPRLNRTSAPSTATWVTGPYPPALASTRTLDRWTLALRAMWLATKTNQRGPEHTDQDPHSEPYPSGNQNPQHPALEAVADAVTDYHHRMRVVMSEPARVARRHMFWLRTVMVKPPEKAQQKPTARAQPKHQIAQLPTETTPLSLTQHHPIAIGTKFRQLKYRLTEVAMCLITRSQRQKMRED